MFGYVRPFKPELKIKEFESYKSVYCGLCKAIGKGYGTVARTTLTYDMTFLAMLRMSVDEENVCTEHFRCALNPFKKKCRASGHRELDYAADASSLLFYYTVKDKIKDPGFLDKLQGIISFPLASYLRKRAMKRSIGLDEKISHALKKLSICETEKKANIDEPAAAFGEVLSDVMSFGIDNKNNHEILKRVGFFLGRWIYIIDAYDDLEKDIKEKSYNPVALLWGKGNISAHDIKKVASEEISYTLTLSLHEALLALQLLDLRRFEGIIMNILERGLLSVQEGILFKEEKN